MTPEEATTLAAAARPSAFERVRTLVGIESPTGDRAASERITALIADWFAPLGEVQRIEVEAGVHLVIDVPGVDAGAAAEGAAGSAGAAPDAGRAGASTEAPLLVVGHTDTVWPAGTLDGELPWSVDGDTVTGPGVFDMKSGIVVALTALELLADRPRRPVRLVLNCDEEIGSPSSAELVVAEARRASAVIAFESPHPDGALKVGRAGSTRVRLAVHGRSAHAALDPEAGISAIDELVDQLLAVRRIVDDTHAAGGRVLCNIGTITGGTRANVVPDEAAAEIGLRFFDGDTEERVLTALAGLTPVRAGARLDVETLSRRPAWAATDADRALLTGLEACASALGHPLGGRPAAGAGDANLTGAAGVPTVDGLGPRGGGAHAPGEHMSLASFEERIALVTLLFAR
ncbi:M20/M25/M40 family metallo-hydrolase [Agromyces archimandritae]|uniref:M20/M25/M40 family metallo-hydrolase n=1 Tax=Agromyces archimandritae TaxID=2781962 RepID=UPI001FD62557|nr:M20/M25/M40 family metallo-hydrolase [Agromyces archimandritae]